MPCTHNVVRLTSHFSLGNLIWADLGINHFSNYAILTIFLTMALLKS